ncbi:hypothetical protein SteCoe_7853 [Stentor coeruleus]|uniref:AAA+ ATPase domain-containing protein n=1 Tax=Stentor coeruleus TaxID=5963 RepID=A0A1R2CLH3_9CILI|nr:hypothetical protein SteCoe_7853 [Stentor coeruleus]
MDNSRETEACKSDNISLKRPKSPEQDTKLSRIKIENSIDNCLPLFKSKPLAPLKPLSPISPNSPSSSDFSDFDTSNYNYVDEFNKTIPNYLPEDFVIQKLEIPKPPIPSAPIIITIDEPIKTQKKQLLNHEDPVANIPDKSHIKIENLTLKDQNIPKKPINKDLSKQPFTEKYQPKSLNEIHANKSICLSIQNWLKTWSSFPPDGKKSILISGPPGIGKTCYTNLICEIEGFTIIQMNASDCRNKQIVSEKIRAFVCNSSMINSKKIGKAVLIMDEVDGMSAGDEGGISALIDCIKISKIPIICICNDRYCKSIKSLANHCKDYKFKKPANYDMKKYITNIIKSENIIFNDNDIQKIIESANGDIRTALNMLEMSKNTQLMEFNKDIIVTMGSFEAVSNLLFEKFRLDVDITERISLFFSDFELINAMIAENYIDICNLKDITNAADALTLADVAITRTRQQQDWSLLSEFAYFSLYAASFTSNKEKVWPRFPETISKSGTRSKNIRLLQDFKHLISPITACCDDESVQMYREVLMEKFVFCNDIEEKRETASLYRVEKNVIKEMILPFVSGNVKEGFSKIKKKDLRWLYAGLKETKNDKDDDEQELVME